ncbi:PRC-barrel domain-containing protein [Pelagerythrobacter rhizovicinus]|uniref:PRC-barrel domain containing protein n=1 Tax=Pelagerythrobacter rhizovicinus TaxID=2268576 RepID=A0A4V1QWL2_9SPHN|nr:PRC-barrel domain-containing protein [Pelagerythrobacter rhizovicinus]RXZ66546.1 PRC-barrel domain containing protein [Pelagerythrobacter rhizovicinus]
MPETAQEAPRDLHHPLIFSSRVTGTPVFDRAGNRLGHVDDLSIEKKSGKTVYAIMSFGGFLGIGARFHPVPWPLLDYDLERDGYVVPLTAEMLKDAPHYEAQEIRLLGGPDHRTYGSTIYDYYGAHGAMPYW